MGKKLSRNRPQKIRPPTETATSWTKIKNSFLFFFGGGACTALVCIVRNRLVPFMTMTTECLGAAAPHRHPRMRHV